MATRPEHKLTYADYAAFPDDGRRWELIEGEAFVVPSPTWKHQDIAGSIYVQIFEYLKVHGGGRVAIAPLDVILDPPDDTVVVQPDVLFVSDADADVITVKNVRGVPTWVIEVVSDPVRDKLVKRDLYMRYGVSEYWAIDPDLRRVEIHRPGRDVAIVDATGRPSPSVLPDLKIDLSSLRGRP